MHLRVLVAACLVAATFGQIVTHLDGVSLAALVSSSDAAVQAGITRPDSTADGDDALDNVNLFPVLPLSARAIYRHYRNQFANLIGGSVVEPETDPFYNLLLVEGRDLSNTNLQVWMVPYNEPNCGVDNAAAVDALPACGFTGPSFNPLSANRVSAAGGIDPERFPTCRLERAHAQGGAYSNAPDNDNKVAYLLPVNRLALHLHQAAWICVRSRNPLTPTKTAVLPINTNLIYQVAPRCDADTPVGGEGIRADDYIDNIDQNPAAGTAIDPFAHACSVQAGVDLAATTGFFYQNAEDVFGEAALTTVAGVSPSNEVDYFERRMRTKCCGWRPGNTLTDASGNVLVKRWGVCINPQLETCCSSREDARGSTTDNIGGLGKPFNRFSEKCCYGGTSTFSAQSNTAIRTAGEPVAISFLDDNCPCDPNRVTDFCGASQQCCSFTKYPELVLPNTTGTIGSINNQVIGRCFDPREESCCDTGEIYNPGVNKCCVVNGVTDMDTPCPCNLDTDCGTTGNDFCCRQVWPAPVETTSCSPYTNYPSGTGDAAAQRCAGYCIDTRFQLCCNGAVCLDEYESCCNNSCCNRFTSDCKMGWRSGASGSRFSTNDFNVPYEVCTEIESVTPYRATFAYILPAGLLAATFLGLAFTLFFAKRMNALNPLSAYERTMMALSLLAVILSWPLYFSPMYKYGLVFIWVALFTIVAALAGLKRLVVIALVLQVIVLIYIFDPFGGNEILNLAYHRVDRLNGFGYSGVFLSVRNLWNDTSSDSFQDALDYPGWRCVDFYDGYFLRDPMTEDRERLHDPMRSTYGYCGREWIAVLLYLSGVITLTYITLFVVTLITHAKNVLVKKVISQNPLHY